MEEVKKQEQKDSKKKEKKEKVNKEEPKIKLKKYEGPAYGYLQKKNNICNIYSLETGSDKKLQKLKGKYFYLIPIIIPNDQDIYSDLLKNTLDSIEKNIPSLNKLNIDLQDILILLFIQKTTSLRFFSNEQMNNIHSFNDFIYLEYTTKDMNNNFNILLFSKILETSIIEYLKLFYINIVPDIMKDNKFLYITVLQCGVFFPENTLFNLMKCLTGPNLQKTSIAIPALETLSEGLFSNIQQYENTHFNIYNLNYYDMSCVIPINSTFNVMKIDNILLHNLNEFYKGIKNNCSMYYHDYSMGIFLKNKGHNVNYISFISGFTEQNDINYSDYMNNYVEKYSGYYANFFNLLHSIIGNIEIIKKVFLIFQLIGMIFEFIYPSLSTMVIYSILYECFNISDGRSAAFLTLIYTTFLLSAGVTFKKAVSIRNMKLVCLFYFVFFEIYYLFVLICSIVAMDNIKKNKRNDIYKFNKVAISLLIIFNFIVGILPMIFSINKILSNIVNMIKYLFLGAPSSSSVFLMAYLFNASEKSGGLKLGDKNGFTLLIFFLFNILFGCLTFFNTNRKKRVNCVLILSIIFTVYNIIKQCSIVIRIVLYEKAFTQVMEEPKITDEIVKNIKELKIENGNNDNDIEINNNGNHQLGNFSEIKKESMFNENKNDLGNYEEHKDNINNISEDNLENINNMSEDHKENINNYSEDHKDNINNYSEDHKEKINNYSEVENSGAFQNDNGNKIENSDNDIGNIDIPI